jgi:hypothetical protein
MDKKQYIELCGYPKGTNLTAKEFSEERKEMANRVKTYEQTQRFKDKQAAEAGEEKPAKSKKKAEAEEQQTED